MTKSRVSINLHHEMDLCRKCSIPPLHTLFRSWSFLGQKFCPQLLLDKLHFFSSQWQDIRVDGNNATAEAATLQVPEKANPGQNLFCSSDSCHFPSNFHQHLPPNSHDSSMSTKSRSCSVSNISKLSRTSAP